MKKEILVVCLTCGNRRDRKHKKIIGTWTGDCDICGEKNTACASAPHDFGIYSIKLGDKLQDLI